MILHNKLRTFLTMLGMNIGVAAVISIMATGLMARTAIMSGVESIGATLIWITPNHELYERRRERIWLRPEDLANMEHLLADVLFSPIFNRSFPLSYRGYEESGRVWGVYPAYQGIWRYPIAYGAFFDQDDIDGYEKTAVIGWETARSFYGSATSAVGKLLNIGNRVFVVKGVFAKRERSFIGDGTDDESVYVAYPVLEDMADWSYFGGPRITSLNIQVNDIRNLDYVSSVLERYLFARYGSYQGEPRFIVHRAEENIDTFNRIFRIITSAISLLAGISLLVSGIGIMNIMLVSVTERNKEIGIRKAVGAKRRDILGQFLTEAIIICLIGGGIGILFGLGISFALAAIQKWRYVMPLFAIVLGISVSAAIGLFFGIYPAMKASKLDPVVALARE